MVDLRSSDDVTLVIGVSEALKASYVEQFKERVAKLLGIPDIKILTLPGWSGFEVIRVTKDAT